jgi:hypothetical protein
MVAFTVMMVAFSAKGGYPEFSLSASAILPDCSADLSLGSSTVTG